MALVSARAGRPASRAAPRAPTGTPGGVVAAQGAVLEQAPALDAVAGRPGHVVDHAERDAGPRTGRVGEVVDRALDPAPAPPLAVPPVGVAAVAGAHVQGHVAERLTSMVSGLPPRSVRCSVARSGWRVPAGRDLDLRPAELLDPPVGPDPGGVVEGAVAVGLLLDDDHDRRSRRSAAARTATRARRWVVGGRPGRLGLADRADAPGAVPGADPRRRGRRGPRRRRAARPPRCPPGRSAEASRMARPRPA